MAIATLVGVLVQSPPLLMPKNDAQVAWAAGADPNPAVANAPAVSAPSSIAPVNFVLIAVPWPIIPPNRVAIEQEIYSDHPLPGNKNLHLSPLRLTHAGVPVCRRPDIIWTTNKDLDAGEAS
jgi:hypothetical protein